ncbi:hypothetical protein [Algoriphagus namhaensis]
MFIALVDLIWGLANVAGILYFFYLLLGLIFRGRSSLRGQPRILATVLLSLGTFALLNRKTETSEQSKVIGAGFLPQATEISYSPLNKLYVYQMIEEQTGESRLEWSDSYFTGFVAGRSWKALQIRNTPVQMEITGQVTYSFFGFKIFSFTTTLTG